MVLIVGLMFYSVDCLHCARPLITTWLKIGSLNKL